MGSRCLQHASVVAFGASSGVILLGPSGSGKSRLALTLIDAGAQLVADDQVFLHENDGALFARTPPTIAGMIEMRGIGLLTLPYRRLARVVLAVRLDLPQGARMPVQENMTLCGVNLPYLIGNDSLSFPAAVRRHVGQQLDKGSARWPI